MHTVEHVLDMILELPECGVVLRGSAWAGPLQGFVEVSVTLTDTASPHHRLYHVTSETASREVEDVVKDMVTKWVSYLKRTVEELIQMGARGEELKNHIRAVCQVTRWYEGEFSRP